MYMNVPAHRIYSKNENCTLKSTSAYNSIIDSSNCQCNSKSVISTIIAIITLLAYCLGNRNLMLQLCIENNAHLRPNDATA